jgi:hypothetical protein
MLVAEIACWVLAIILKYREGDSIQNQLLIILFINLSYVSLAWIRFNHTKMLLTL